MTDTADDLELGIIDLGAALAGTCGPEDLGRRYIEGVGHLLPAVGRALCLHESPGSGPWATVAHGVGDYYLARYDRVGRPRDPVLAAAVRTGRAADNGSLMPVGDWCALPVYREVFHLHELVSVLLAPVTAGGSFLGTINFGRGPDEPPFDAHDRRMADLVARVTGVALSAVRRHTGVVRECTVLRAALDATEEAVVATDTGQGRRYMNAAARALVASLRHGEAALERAVAGASGAALGGTEVELTSGATATLTARATVPGGDATVTAVALTLRTPRRTELPAPLRPLLTARERDVAELVADGLRDTDIAQRLFLSPHTVKQHVRAVYAKLGVRSRVDLTRLVLASS